MIPRYIFFICAVCGGLCQVLCLTHSVSLCVLPAIPGVERVFPRDDVCAVPSNEHLDAVVERENSGLGDWVLLDDLQRVPRAPAQGTVLTWTLNAAVWVHAVCQSI